MKKILATAALAALLPLAANAATVVSIGDFVSGDITLLPGDSSSFEFEAGERMRISGVAYTLNGFNSSDLLNVKFGLNVADISLAPGDISSVGGVAQGGTIIPSNLKLAAGDLFSIEVTDGIALPVNFDFTLTPTEVPVPAAGLLLGTVLLGGGIAARRKKKA